MIKQLENTQMCYYEESVCITKRSHHSQLLDALDISGVDYLSQKSTNLLYNRISQTDTPLLYVTCVLIINLLYNRISQTDTHYVTCVLIINLLYNRISQTDTPLHDLCTYYQFII